MDRLVRDRWTRCRAFLCKPLDILQNASLLLLMITRVGTDKFPAKIYMPDSFYGEWTVKGAVIDLVSYKSPLFILNI